MGIPKTSTNSRIEWPSSKNACVLKSPLTAKRIKPSAVADISWPFSFLLQILQTLDHKMDLTILQWSMLQSGSQAIDFNYRFCDDYFCLLLLSVSGIFCLAEQPNSVKQNWGCWDGKITLVKETNTELIVIKIIINWISYFPTRSHERSNFFFSSKWFPPLPSRSHSADHLSLCQFCKFGTSAFTVDIYWAPFHASLEPVHLQSTFTGLHFMQTIILPSSLMEGFLLSFFIFFGLLLLSFTHKGGNNIYIS